MENSPEPSLIRKGNHTSNPLEKIVTDFQPPRDTKTYLPKFLTKESFIYPIGKFPAPIDMQGKPLDVQIDDTGQRIEIQPDFTIRGASSADGGLTLVKALYPHYESQIQGVRLRLDGLLRRTLGISPTAQLLSDIAAPESVAYQELQKAIAAELGLDVAWKIQLGGKVGEWLSRLMHACPSMTTLKYNEELPSTEFKLEFSISVVRPEPRYMNRLLGRFEGNLTPEEELKRLSNRVHKITNPAFRKALIGITRWNEELVHELAQDGFQRAVSKRLVKEFGYHVSFSDFTPAPNEQWIKAMTANSPLQIAQAQVDQAKKLYDKFLKLQEDAGDRESMAKVIALDEEVEQARQRWEKAQTNLLNKAQERPAAPISIEQSMVEELKLGFRDTVLKLESGSDETNTKES